MFTNTCWSYKSTEFNRLSHRPLKTVPRVSNSAEWGVGGGGGAFIGSQVTAFCSVLLGGCSRRRQASRKLHLIFIPEKNRTFARDTLSLWKRFLMWYADLSGCSYWSFILLVQVPLTLHGLGSLVQIRTNLRWRPGGNWLRVWHF